MRGLLVTYDNRIGRTFGHLVRPPTSTGHLSRWRVRQLDWNEDKESPSHRQEEEREKNHRVIGKAGRAVVLVGFSVLALPEDTAVDIVREGSIQPETHLLIIRIGRAI